MFWIFKSSTRVSVTFREGKKETKERERETEKTFLGHFGWPPFFGVVVSLLLALFGSCHLASIRYRFLLQHVVPAAAAAVQRIPVRHFRCFPFCFFTLCRTDYFWLCVSLLFHFHLNSLRVPGRAAQPLRLHDDNANDETLHQRRVHGHFRRLGNLQPRPSQRIPMELSRLFIFISSVVVYSFAHHRGAFRNFSRRPFSLSLV